MTPEVDAELEPDDVFLARLAAMRAKRKAAKEAAAEGAKPKLVAAVSPEIAEAIKTNPSSLRLSVNRADDIPVVDRPRRTELLEVLEVDARLGLYPNADLWPTCATDFQHRPSYRETQSAFAK
jgi:hypothetical protein